LKQLFGIERCEVGVEGAGAIFVRIHFHALHLQQIRLNLVSAELAISSPEKSLCPHFHTKVVSK
jgi:hypothetical protein